MIGDENALKRFAIVVGWTALLSLVLCGCDSWLDGSYVSVTPHLEQNILSRNEIVVASNYAEMRDSLADMIETGATGGVLSLGEMEQSAAREYMDTAVQYLRKNNPICAYAVESITYDIGSNREGTVIAYQINYYHGRSEILRIELANSSRDAKAEIADALVDHDSSLVLRIKEYEAVDFTQMVHDYAHDHPDVVMEIPTVSVSIYPDTGKERVVALSFTYETSREVLLQMRKRVEQVFLSAELYVKGATQVSDIYAQLYSFLMKRYDYTVETSITPSYSLLLHGIGDSRAFANIYASMCRESELDCKVISGTKNGIPWCWNLVRLRDEYYHVDLLACEETGEFRMLESADMAGYVWDYSAYGE